MRRGTGSPGEVPLSPAAPVTRAGATFPRPIPTSSSLLPGTCRQLSTISPPRGTSIARSILRWACADAFRFPYALSGRL